MLLQKRDSDGRSPADLALSNGHRATAALIEALTRSLSADAGDGASNSSSEAATA